MTEAENDEPPFALSFEEIVEAINTATSMDLDHDAGEGDVSPEVAYEGVARAMEEAGLSRSAAQAFAVPEGAGEQALLKLHSPGFHERVAGDNARLYASAEWAGFNRGLMVGLIAAGRRLRRSSG